MPERRRITPTLKTKVEREGKHHGQIDEIFSADPLAGYTDLEIDALIKLFIKEDNLIELYVTQMALRLAQNEYTKEENEERLRLSVTVLENFLPDNSEDETGEPGVLTTYAGLTRKEYIEMFNQTREELAVQYYIVAFGIASSYYTKVREYIPLDLMDLVQVGNQGILRAIDTFDPSNGAIFFSYAKSCCHNTIRRFLDKNPDSPLKVSLNAVSILRMVRRLHRQISGTADEPISFTDPDFLQYAFEEVNKKLGKQKDPTAVSYEVFEAAINSYQFHVSFEELFVGEDGVSDWQDVLSTQDVREDGDIHFNKDSADILAENDFSIENVENTIQTFFKRSPKLYRAVCIWHRFGKPYEDLPDHKKEDSYRVKLQSSIKDDYRNALARLKHEPTLAAYYALLTTE